MEEERPSMGTVYEVDFLEKFDELVRRYAESHSEEFEEWKRSRRRKQRPPEGEGHEDDQGKESIRKCPGRNARAGGKRISSQLSAFIIHQWRQK